MPKSKRSKACDISPAVKAEVRERDGGCCIICGSPNGAPNAHYIPRSDGGLGIPQNVVTLCPVCHHDYDNGGKRQEYGAIIRNYLKGQYPGWDETKLRFDKWGWAK